MNETHFNNITSTHEESVDLVSQLRLCSQDIHDQIEQTRFVNDMIEDTLSIEAYSLYIHQLWKVYKVLEFNLKNHPLGTFSYHSVARANSIEKDLEQIQKKYSGLNCDFRVLDSTLAYVHHLESLTDPCSYHAHAYVRYLGDLSGGQIIKKCLKSTYQLQDECLHFYQFNENPAQIKKHFKEELNQASLSDEEKQMIVDECKNAFYHNYKIIAELDSLKDHSLDSVIT